MTTPQDANLQQRRPSTVGTLVYLLFGLILWAIQFTAVYLVHTLVCNGDAPATVASTFVVLLSTGIAIAVVAAVLNGDKLARMLGLGAEAHGRATYDGIFRLIAVLSIIAIVWSGATALIVMAC